MIEALKVKTFIPPLDLHMKRLVARSIARIRTTKAAIEIMKVCDRIRKQTIEKRERRAALRPFLVNRMNK